MAPDEQIRKNNIFHPSFYNPVSIAGAVIAAVSLATTIFLTLIEFIQKESPPYIGIVAYVIVPVFLVFGIILFFIGAWRELRRRRRGKPASRLSFTLDLNLPKQRMMISIVTALTVIFLLFTAYGSYRTFEWTESVEFCGSTCHEVMEPEYTAYQNSPHARVKCVDCHVGAGAGWYVRSKLSGAYQVYATLANVYPKPIPTPIENLRPAQETCEQCHWPSHFSGEKKYINTYFKSDEQNTPWTIALLMKVGGGTAGRTPTSGIHWSMNIANEITYVAADTQRQIIPKVKSKNKQTGAETEYVSTEALESAEGTKSLPSRTMDCIDCHNRPSHIYRPPVRIVDQSLAAGAISAQLPNIRTIALQALGESYETAVAAADSIPIVIENYYRENHPSVAGEKKEFIQTAGKELVLQYRTNIFPQMKVNWKVYPNNIGHMTDLGCFRCHDGKHVSADGKVLTKDCNSCHTILYQGTDPKPASLSVAGLPFQHPEDIGDSWQETVCRECHGNN
jgi:hypothetical protein